MLKAGTNIFFIIDKIYRKQDCFSKNCNVWSPTQKFSTEDSQR